MIFIGGISMGRKDFDFRQTMICKKCGRYSSISVFMMYSYISFFFIPLFKWGRKYYAVSNCCQAVYALDAELGKAIEHGESVNIREEDLTLVGTEHTQVQHCPDCGCLLEREFAYCPKCGRKI